MKIADYLLILLIVSLVVLAIRAIRSGKSGTCSGNCAECMARQCAGKQPRKGGSGI